MSAPTPVNKRQPGLNPGGRMGAGLAIFGLGVVWFITTLVNAINAGSVSDTVLGLVIAFLLGGGAMFLGFNLLKGACCDVRVDLTQGWFVVRNAFTVHRHDFSEMAELRCDVGARRRTVVVLKNGHHFSAWWLREGWRLNPAKLAERRVHFRDLLQQGLDQARAGGPSTPASQG